MTPSTDQFRLVRAYILYAQHCTSGPCRLTSEHGPAIYAIYKWHRVCTLLLREWAEGTLVPQQVASKVDCCIPIVRLAQQADGKDFSTLLGRVSSG